MIKKFFKRRRIDELKARLRAEKRADRRRKEQFRKNLEYLKDIDKELELIGA